LSDQCLRLPAAPCEAPPQIPLANRFVRPEQVWWKLGMVELEAVMSLRLGSARLQVMNTRKPYPSDVSDDEWALVAPYLTLLPGSASMPEVHSVRGQGRHLS
jgi:hypothetical protein